ncbi:xylulokinase [Bowdeniella massiliensis]|uniref:xylulokinase n=1 Tax=Bowdeniella massiliensis TaxID=2932264 RepID=UPI0020280734|nr:xylulokinase [Bowdeniella massiliensis]
MARFVAGVDSSTQSCKVLIVDPDSGEIIRSGAAPHPGGTEVSAEAWWQAFRAAAREAGGLSDVAAISVGGQQHGLVTLDASGELVRDALLWNDTRSAKAASELTEELGAQTWAEACGSVPVASLTVSKVRWLAEHEPQSLERTAAICLPHDYLSWRLAGTGEIADLTTDRSDASGTGYLDLRTAEYRLDLLARALKASEARAADIQLPRVVAPFDVAGEVTRDIEEIGLAAGTLIGPGCGDNAGAALGLGLQPGEASISIGTSGVVAVVSDKPVWDPNGVITGFMDATGNWLPLVCTLNGARILSSTAELLGVDFAAFDELALSVADGAGLEMTPYFEGERTPNLPDATASLTGMTLANWDRAHLAHAAVRALAILMANAAAAVSECGVRLSKVRLIGGGARSAAVQRILPEVLGIDVDVPAPAEYVALGAAKQAANVLKRG